MSKERASPPEPKATLAAGTALHRVERLDDGRCSGYLGFGEVEGARASRRDGGEKLGHYAPDLELGPVTVPCEALGGASDDLPKLTEPSPDAEWFTNPLQLTPIRDEVDGAEHYEALELEIRARPEPSESISVRATAQGAQVSSSRARPGTVW